jgi:hypothetical protein
MGSSISLDEQDLMKEQDHQEVRPSGNALVVPQGMKNGAEVPGGLSSGPSSPQRTHPYKQDERETTEPQKLRRTTLEYV